MKPSIFAMTLLLSCLGCASPESDQPDPRQIEQIKRDVKVVADSIWAKWEGMDPEAARQYFADSAEWTSFNSQGLPYDIHTYSKLATDFRNSATAYKWTTTRQDFKVVAKDIVICTWTGKDETVWKSGDKMTCDPHAYTLVFKKISGQWRLVHSHDSGIAVTQKAAME